MKNQIKKVAVATCVDGQALYDVTYPGHPDMDARVRYDYLRRLAKRGYEVRVSATPGNAAHTIGQQQ